jgi:hypothetical protein
VGKAGRVQASTAPDRYREVNPDPTDASIGEALAARLQRMSDAALEQETARREAEMGRGRVVVLSQVAASAASAISPSPA